VGGQADRLIPAHHPLQRPVEDEDSTLADGQAERLYQARVDLQPLEAQVRVPFHQPPLDAVGVGQHVRERQVGRAEPVGVDAGHVGRVDGRQEHVVPGRPHGVEDGRQAGQEPLGVAVVVVQVEAVPPGRAPGRVGGEDLLPPAGVLEHALGQERLRLRPQVGGRAVLEVVVVPPEVQEGGQPVGGLAERDGLGPRPVGPRLRLVVEVDAVEDDAGGCGSGGRHPPPVPLPLAVRLQRAGDRPP